MPGPPFSGYALRRVTVAPDLEALRGPLQGTFRLPLHLDASARAVYDFASRPDRELAYRVVLLEAGSPIDHEQWLDPEELLRLWADLYLPRVVRAAWQAEHLILAQIGANPLAGRARRDSLEAAATAHEIASTPPC